MYFNFLKEKYQYNKVLHGDGSSGLEWIVLNQNIHFICFYVLIWSMLYIQSLSMSSPFNGLQKELCPLNKIQRHRQTETTKEKTQRTRQRNRERQRGRDRERQRDREKDREIDREREARQNSNASVAVRPLYQP